jgi:hypothetical protein
MKKKILVLSVLCCGFLLVQPLNQLSFAQTNQKKITIKHKQLTQKEAKQLLLKYNNKVNYIYQGDSSQFQALKDKKLQGYVFLPDVETDIGYFVDKTNSNIYFFHPSGYLELITNS